MEHIAILEKSFDKTIQCKSLKILIHCILNKIDVVLEELNIKFDESLISDTANNIYNSFKNKNSFVWELDIIPNTTIRLVFSKHDDDWFVTTHFKYWVEKIL